jgi:hypothetical protein
MLYVVLRKLTSAVVSGRTISLGFAGLRLAVSCAVIVGSVLPVSHSPGFGTRRCLVSVTF